MTSSTVSVRFQWRRDLASNWAEQDPVLLDGEPGWESDTSKFKVGDGATAWNSLPYFDGVLGTIPISGGGTGATTTSGARNNLGLGSMAIKNTGSSGSFTTVDGKTVTVVDGIITSIA